MKLKPCPFCGDEPSVSSWNQGKNGHDRDLYHKIGCDTCDYGIIRGDKEKVINLWNRRVEVGKL